MSRAAVLAIIFATACAGRHHAPPEPLEDPPVSPLTPTDEVRAIDTRTEEMKRAAERPSSPRVTPPDANQDPYAAPAIAALITQIDPHEYERWPLTPNQHPSLEPAYAIARVLADPGVSWTDLCRMGAQNRRGGGLPDQLEYLRAWCDVAKRDASAAIARLRPLVNSSVLGMPAAVRTDIANILVDTSDATAAQQILTSARIDDLAVLDLLAASYAEVGKTADAIVFADLAIDAHDARKPLDQCRRIARKVLLVHPTSRSPVIHQLARFNDVPACAAMYNELACWHQRFCDPYLLAHGVPDDTLALGNIYKDWPQPTAAVAEWLTIAKRASYYPDSAGSQEAATRAIEAGIRSTQCTGQHLGELTDLAKTIALSTRDRELAERLAVITKVPETLCAPR